MRTKLLTVALLLSCFSAAAQQGPFDEKFKIWLGAFRPSLDTSIQWDTPGGIIGDDITFERTLGIDNSKSTLNAELQWRFFPKHSLHVRYFNLERSGTTDVPLEVTIKGITFPIQTPTSSFFDTEVFSVGYAFAPIKRDNMILDLTFGLSIQDISLGILAPDVNFDERSQVTAPLPTLGIGFGYAFAQKWLVKVNGGWFQLKVDNIKGKITEFRAGIEWHAFKNVGFELAYNVFEVDVDVESAEDTFLGSLKYQYEGPLFGVTARF
ncbi:MAG: hypothetical protein O7H39_09115 [Gammaproteobacteria bacterium]|nr:hypothetical protein [Gammaproteobacteria bacterium]